MLKFKELQSKFNNHSYTIIKEEFKDKDLINMIIYSLNNGKRLRPIIAIDICLSLGKQFEDVIFFALGIELIHTSSLIIDDLPYMDNDSYRRNQLSFHKKFGDYKAEIVSRIMLNTGIKYIYQNFKHLDQTMFDLFINNLVKNLGIEGATGGQLLDLTPFNIHNKNDVIESFKNREFIQELLTKKTSTLFEIAFLGGYLSGHYNTNDINKLKECANSFGLAFQLYDDYDDINQDKNRIKLNLYDPNYINNFGIDETEKLFINKIKSFKKNMELIGLYSDIMNELLVKLKSRFNL